jgi:hypothetical protein
MRQVWMISNILQFQDSACQVTWTRVSLLTIRRRPTDIGGSWFVRQSRIGERFERMTHYHPVPPAVGLVQPKVDAHLEGHKP